MRLRSGLHVTLPEAEFQPLILSPYPQSDSRRRAASRWAVPQIYSRSKCNLLQLHVRPTGPKSNTVTCYYEAGPQM